MNTIDVSGARILALTESTSGIERQFNGEFIQSEQDLEGCQSDLANNISTDEITPGWSCFWYDKTLAEYCYVGFRNKAIANGQVKNFSPTIVVSGFAKGCGSSREHAPFAEKAAGIKIVVARSFEKIYYQNCINIGLLPTTDFSIFDYVFSGKPVPLSFFTKDMSSLDKQIVEAGGLFNFNKHLCAGNIRKPNVPSQQRPRNIVEKILDKNRVASFDAGDENSDIFCEADLRFSHEYVTAMSYGLFKGAFGDAEITDPDSVVCFQDHLTLLKTVLPEEKAHLLLQANTLAYEQQKFVDKFQLKHYGPGESSIENAICHNAVLEDLALPGQVIIGTDSHTCTAGALGALAFGVGATDMANAWYSKNVRLRRPKVIRVELTESLNPLVTAKDVALHILSEKVVQEGQTLGCVLLYCGTGAASLSMEDRATITNMAVEAGATTAIFEPDQVTLEYLTRQGRFNAELIAINEELRSDPGARYYKQLNVDLSSIQAMLSLPGDPRNTITIAEKKTSAKILINKAYGGSCTGGKAEDMDMYASVISAAKAKNQQLAQNVDFYIQYGSEKVKQYCIGKGYDKLFSEMGVTVIEPSCGACINAGPGVSKNENDVTISSQNRNFPGRSGPGKVYLGSPYVVASSAFAGYITEYGEEA